MKPSSLLELAELADHLIQLRDMGMSEYRSGDFVLVFSPKASTSAAIAAIPSTPEQPGKADTYVPPPSKDIFDVLSDGVIPGAPTRDGFPVDPSTA